MTLEEFRIARGLSIEALAQLLEVTAEAARLYLRGKRIPQRKTMLKIREISDGAVTADSFYVPDALPEDESQDEAADPQQGAAA